MADNRSPQVRFVEVDESHAGQRLDNFLLGYLKGVPRSRVYRLLRRGEVRINRGRAGPGYRLAVGDVVRVPPVRTAPVTETRGGAMVPPPAPVLYEDDALIVVDKPSGLAVHGGTGLAGGLIEQLRASRPGTGMLELVHRLDRDTSGCLLVARRRDALVKLNAMFRGAAARETDAAAEPRVRKRYLALVMGDVGPGPRQVQAALRRNVPRGGERLTAVSGEGRESRTLVVPRWTHPTASLVEIELLTGRTHQARAHMAHIGHPVAGDTRYGSREFNAAMRPLGLRRLFLHAHSLSFAHPLHGRRLTVTSPLPSVLEEVAARVRGTAG